MKFISIALLVVAGTLPLFAQTNAVRVLTLEECIRIALENNLEVRIERLSPQIARFNLDAARAFYDPVFEATAVHSFNSREGGLNIQTGQPFPSTTTENDTFAPGIRGVLPTGLTYDLRQNLSHRQGSSRGAPFDFYEGTTGINLRQPLLRDAWIDGNRQAILVGRKSIQISEAQLAEQINFTIARVEQTYYDLIFAREDIQVHEKARELAERHVMENRRRVEVGTMAPLDETQAEAQLADARANLIQAQINHQLAQNALKTLLTGDFQEWHGVEIQPQQRLTAIPEHFDIADSWRRGLAERPELRQLRLDIERRDITLRFQRNQLYPSLDLIGSYGHNAFDTRNVGGLLSDTRRGDDPFYSYGVVLSVPLSNRGPRSRYNAGKSEKEQALLRLQQVEQDVLVQIDNAIKTARASLERVDATRAARKYAEAALDAEQKKLEAGRSTSFVVLQLQRDLTAARSREIRALADYNKALAQLSFAEGSILQRHQLDLR